MTMAEAVAKRITQLCKEKELTLKDLSIQSGVCMATLRSYYKKPDKNIRFLTILKLCKAFQISIVTFFDSPYFD